jgi:hypothetical protein
MDAIPPGSRTITLSAEEADYVEFCLTQRRELLAVADATPDGTVLARAEQATRTAARLYGHRLLVEGMNRRVTSAEKKKRDRHESAGAAHGV